MAKILSVSLVIGTLGGVALWLFNAATSFAAYGPLLLTLGATAFVALLALMWLRGAL